jgi:hypothetical protein
MPGLRDSIAASDLPDVHVMDRGCAARLDRGRGASGEVMVSRVLRDGIVDSEAIAVLHDRTFRLYVHLILRADDYGLVEIDYGPIKRAAPLLDWNRELVAKMLSELVDAAMLIPYEVEGKRYAAIAKWQSNVNSKSPKHPIPPFGMGHVRKPYKYKSSEVREAAQKILRNINKRTSGSDTPVTHSVATGAALVPEEVRGKGVKITTTGLRPVSKQEGDYSAVFLEAWAKYPKRVGDNPKAAAWKAWRARLAQGASEDEMLAGVERYAAFVRATDREGTEFVKQAQTFFGPNLSFREAWVPPTGSTRPAGVVL